MWAVASVPVVLGLLLAHPVPGGPTESNATMVASLFAMLAAAVGFAAHQHQTSCSASGWVSAALTVLPVAVSTVAIAEAADPRAFTVIGAAVLHLTGGALSLGCIVAAGAHTEAPRTPVSLGLAAGAAVSVVTVVASLAAPGVSLHSTAGLVVVGVLACSLAGTGVVAARIVLLRRDLGPWVRGPVVLGGAAVALSAPLSTWSPRSPGVVVATIVLQLMAWVCFITVAVRLLSLVSRLRNESLDVAADRAGRRESELRQARIVLHEVRATVAGLAGATELMAGPDPLPPETTTRLRSMERSELARIQRLLSQGAPRPHKADLGDILGPVVESIRARGHDVGMHGVRGHHHHRADDVAHIVHVLLDNAARHGRDPIRLTLRDRGDGVLISVYDAGPGVPDHLRDHLFDWGASGAGSTGIGLYDALARARSIGGVVLLRDRDQADSPTCFQVDLPSGSVHPS